MSVVRYTPCAHCPFRMDVPPFLMHARAQEIAKSLTDPGGTTFPCHETVTRDVELVDLSKSKACAGSLMIQGNRPNQMTRIMERLGCFDPSKLSKKVRVYPTLKAWVAAHKSRTRKSFREAVRRKK